MTPGDPEPIPVDFSEDEADARAVPKAKAGLRREIRRRVGTMPPEAKAAASARICELIRELPEYAKARAVALYCALPDEVDLTELVEGAVSSGRDVLLPVTDTERRQIRFVSVADPRRDLREGSYGILEPRRGMPLADPSHLDLVFVPGRAFDARGGRLGRGAGYYDGFLSDLRPHSCDGALKLGVGFSCQLVEAVPMEVRDVRLDGVVTEDGVTQTDR